MRRFNSIVFFFAGLCVHTSNGFAGPRSRSIRLSPGIRGPLAARPVHHEVRDAIEMFKPDVIVDEKQSMPASKKHTANLRNTIGIIAPYAALATVAVFSLPAASNALSTTDIASVAGGASSSEWFDSLTGSGFYQAFSLVFVSEIGDKTFFVAALLAAKISRLISFVGSIGALAVMTVISVIIGQVFHAVPSEIANGVPLDDIAAIVAFTYFGVKILTEAFDDEAAGKSFMDEELEEAEEAVEGSDSINKVNAGAQIASIFALVFAAEFGDRSFLATIALSAAQDPVCVAAGAIAAHAVATGIAVIGGAYISKYVSEKIISYIGGTLFLIFAATTAYGVF